MKKEFSESDLYLPIKKYFTKLGYKVKSEVLNCDLVAIKENEIIIVELKKNFSLELLYQGIDRFKYTGFVYVAIPKTKNKTSRKIDSKRKKILNAIDLGFIYVNMYKTDVDIDIILNPKEKNRDNIYKKKLINEFENRTFDSNIGGINKKKILTAYREQAIKIACVLRNNGENSAKKLIAKYGCPENTHSILYSNYYGWFENTNRGIYKLSENGISALKEITYLEIVNLYESEGEQND